MLQPCRNWYNWHTVYGVRLRLRTTGVAKSIINQLAYYKTNIEYEKNIPGSHRSTHHFISDIKADNNFTTCQKMMCLNIHANLLVFIWNSGNDVNKSRLRLQAILT